MEYKINMSGANIEITATNIGDYKSYEDVLARIKYLDEKFVVKDIFLTADGVRTLIPDGLNKIKEGLSVDDLLTADNKNEWVMQFAKEHATAMQIAAEKNLHRRSQLNKNIAIARNTGDWREIPDNVVNEMAADIILTTSMFVANHDIDKELDVVTAECAFGMNIFRDLFAAVRDVVGGRSRATEKVLHNARVTSLSELRRKAVMLGADAVIAIDLDYVELSGGGKNGMLLAVSSGTAVKLKATTVP